MDRRAITRPTTSRSSTSRSATRCSSRSSPTRWCRPSSGCRARALRSSPRPATRASIPPPASRLRRRRRSVQRAFGDLRRLARHAGHAGSRRRSRLGFELARPDAFRSARQAGSGCARRQHRVAGGAWQPPVHANSTTCACPARTAGLEYFTLSGTSMASPVGGGRGGAAAAGEPRALGQALKLSLQFTARLLRRPTC